ncbi:lipopolysaccharide biosynthesis protein [Bacillus suaedaesalsae]|uniref:Oligosaccharide flippase family protein n=1 Tax=Bacillus suaedaesalsae TaxID=2810349 RepID=A0ABS2DL10_9BACI|nr:MATE family efflux transporter [Bacillus suaedaesalsae]MBM6619096.1 oligosaccharide flippase family protein [Bacillus suaedaesalsae]
MYKNILANILGRLWSMFSIYFFIPLYIYFLGEEAFGLITFFATLQTVLNILGMGLSKTLRRVFASGEDTNKNNLYKYRMMRSIELIYVGIALFIIFICSISANLIANEWLKVGTIDINSVEFTIRLMGISIGLQLLASLYSGCLFGMEYQVRANAYIIGWSIFKNAGAVLLIWLIDPQIRLFYSWHIISDLLYLLILRFTVIKLLNKNIKLTWTINDFKNVKDIWKFSTGLIVISIGYVLNTQLDKTIISKYMPLVTLGAYNIAFTLGSLTSVFTSAIATAAFSRFTQYYTLGRKKDLRESFLRFNKSVGLSVIVLGVFIAVFSKEILLLWTGNPQIVQVINSSSFYIIIGTTFLSLQIIPYEYMLSVGNTKVNNILTFSSVPYVLLVTPLLIINFGILGASISWFIQMILSTFLYLFFIHSKYIGENNTLKWLFSETVLPMVITLLIAFGSKELIKIFNLNLFLTLISAILLGLVTIIFIYSIFNREMLSSILNIIIKSRKEVNR